MITLKETQLQQWCVISLFIKYDIFYPLRKWTTGQDYRVKTGISIWDSALSKHYGYAIVETNTNEFLLGKILEYTIDEPKERELLLLDPEIIDLNNGTQIKVKDHIGLDVDKIIFLTNDIRRIYLIPSNLGEDSIQQI